MTRVAVIAGDPPSLVRFRGHFLEAVSGAGHELHVFAPPDEATAAWLAERDIPFHPLDLDRAAISPVRDLRFAARLRRELRRLRPDLVLATTIKPTVYALPAARLAGVPRRFALITGLGYAFTGGEGGMRRRLVGVAARALCRIGLRSAAGVIFQNEDDRNEFAGRGLLGRTPAHVVNGSGVDIDEFAPVPLPEKPRFLMIARLLHDKGLAEYIEAARLVKAARPAAEFDLVGGADANPSAFPESEVRAATAAGILAWHGSVADVRPHIAAARIFVLPSYREGTSRAVLEAMAMGRPVITTDAPGGRAAVADGGNGLLVPPRDAGALAAAMIRLIDAPDVVRRMGASSSAIAEERYDVRLVTADLMRILGL